MNSPESGSEREAVYPFLKWPGGKRWLANRLTRCISGLKFNRYFEPFLGGGALFFSLHPPKATLSDLNEDLIDCYKQVRVDADLLVKKIRAIPVNAESYDRVRKSAPRDRSSKAARLLYLNRTSFSGLYRLNRSGHFNVPYGGGERTPEALWRDDLLLKAAAPLRKARLVAGDFEDVLQDAETGDLVYCDPTYTVAHNNNGYGRYNEKNFAWDDQKRLAACCRKLARRGVVVIVSNAVHPDILELFRPDRYCVIERQSLLCPSVDKRRVVREALLVFGKRSCVRTMSLPK